jgi:hypothetical protein
MVSGDRLIKIVRAIGIFRPVVLLRLVAGAGEIVIRERGSELVAENGLNR